MQQTHSLTTPRYRQQRALTLIEVLIVVAILGILAALALPSMSNFIQSNRVRATIGELIASLGYAKGEAITRGYPVSICPISSTEPTVCGDTTDWSNGWAVFINEDNATTPSSDDALLRVIDDINDNFTFETDIDFINFQSSGFPDPGFGRIVITPTNCVGSNQRQLDISATGRVDVDVQICPVP